MAEFERVSLGDKRLERRLTAITRAMELAPGNSLVEQAGSVAALEATYRFLSNPRVVPEAVFEGHAVETAKRAAEFDSVLVIHDTTEFRFGGVKERQGLGRISTQKRDGFLAHFSICVSPAGEPLGSLELFAWSRLDREKRSKAQGSLLDPNRESLRWADSAARASERLDGKTSPIHVMDREGDNFELFATLVEHGERFVIRLGHDRRLKKGRGRDGSAMLHEELHMGPARLTRTVELGRRERDPCANKHEVFPERAARTARLEVRAKQIRLYRAHQHPEHLPESLVLNFVEAWEVDAPSGADPVVWRLITTERIDTDAQLCEVIDIYKRRWLIEEFFKALKTGCRFESLQLENIRGLLIALSIESAIAWQILRLRYVARHQPKAPGRPLLTREQFDTLRRLRASWGQNDEEPSVEDVVADLARLGVHLPNNGAPGWLVLKRGLKRLNSLGEGLRLAFFPGPSSEEVINR